MWVTILLLLLLSEMGKLRHAAFQCLGSSSPSRRAGSEFRSPSSPPSSETALCSSHSMSSDAWRACTDSHAWELTALTSGEILQICSHLGPHACLRTAHPDHLDLHNGSGSRIQILLLQKQKPPSKLKENLSCSLSVIQGL